MSDNNPPGKEIRLNPEQAIQLFENERAKYNAIQEQFVRLEEGLEETIRTRDALQAMQKANANESVLVPLGAGVYATATLQENQNVLTTMAGGVIKTETIETTLKLLENRKNETEKELQKTQEQLLATRQNLDQLNQMLQMMANKAQQGKA